MISGYLITKSFIQTKGFKYYFVKRILRIFPGYLICFLICDFLIAPFVGSDKVHLSFKFLTSIIGDIIFLRGPSVAGAFHGLHHAALDGSMWTIPYEFKCYIATALLGLIGLYRAPLRLFLLCAVLALIFLDVAGAIGNPHAVALPLIGSLWSIIGHPSAYVRFAALYSTGAIYYLFHNRVSFNNLGAAVSFALLIPMLFSHSFAEAAFAVFGGYLIFWFALKVNVLRISRLVNKGDISYGLYLYAFPVQNLVIWKYRDINPWLLCFIALVCAGSLAYGSWMLVEKPCLSLVRKKRSTMQTAGCPILESLFDSRAGDREPQSSGQP